MCKSKDNPLDKMESRYRWMLTAYLEKDIHYARLDYLAMQTERNQTEITTSEPPESVAFEVDTADLLNLTSCNFENVIENEQLAAAIHTLSPLQKRVLFYSVLEGYSSREIAELLGYSRQWINRIRKTALQQLRHGMSEERDSPCLSGS